MKFKRIFLLILDSLGVGEAQDANNYDDKRGIKIFDNYLEAIQVFKEGKRKAKATTNEKMGEIGRSEAIQAHAVILLRKKVI